MPRGERRARRAVPESRPGRFVEDPLSGETAELRAVQPVAATKAYRCPGCNHEITPGTGHVVIVPLGDPAGRRHWHHACWEQRHRRRPGR